MRYPYAYDRNVNEEGNIVAVNVNTLKVLNADSSIESIKLDEWILQKRGKDIELAWSKKFVWIYEDDDLSAPPVDGYHFLSANGDTNLFIREDMQEV